MRLITNLFASFISNVLAILLASSFISGFTILFTIQGIATVAGLLTLVNIVIRPVIRFVLTPVIVLTLGIASFVINMILLAGLDFFLESLTIEGFVPLLYATILISFVNIVIHFFARHLS